MLVTFNSVRNRSQWLLMAKSGCFGCIVCPAIDCSTMPALSTQNPVCDFGSTPVKDCYLDRYSKFSSEVPIKITMATEILPKTVRFHSTAS